MSTGLTLVMLAAGGTAALCGAAYLFGFNKSVNIADEADAKRHVSDYAPEALPAMCVLSSDHASALVTGADDKVFLVTMLGDSPVVRQITARNITQIDSRNIQIDVSDLGVPKRIFSADATSLKLFVQTLEEGLLQ